MEKISIAVLQDVPEISFEDVWLSKGTNPILVDSKYLAIFERQGFFLGKLFYSLKGGGDSAWSEMWRVAAHAVCGGTCVGRCLRFYEIECKAHVLHSLQNLFYFYFFLEADIWGSFAWGLGEGLQMD